MISAKSPREIATMKQAGKIVALARAAVAAAIAPGVTTKQLDRIAERVIRQQGASPSFKGYGGFPASICTSINSVLVHGIPDQTALKDGDLISIDIGACYKGYHGDAAWTFAVGRVSEEAVRLMEVTRQSLFIGLEQAKPGNRLSDISHAIGDFVRSAPGIQCQSLYRSWNRHAPARRTCDSEFWFAGQRHSVKGRHDVRNRTDGSRRQAAHTGVG